LTPTFGYALIAEKQETRPTRLTSAQWGAELARAGAKTQTAIKEKPEIVRPSQISDLWGYTFLYSFIDNSPIFPLFFNSMSNFLFHYTHC
jgi:hypothetical protein